MDFQIYGLDPKGKRTRLAHTPSARAARLYHGTRSSESMKVVVCFADTELSGDELDVLAARDDRLSKRF